jgi:V/A-type H+-transporting ATPase subunit D
MAKIKFTKNELKRQKDALTLYKRYLPTLMLKKQQLQLEIRRVQAEQRQREQERDGARSEILRWVDVFGEEVNLERLVRVERVRTTEGNIAGVDIPVFAGVDIEEAPYDLFLLPLWVDAAVEWVRRLAVLDAQIRVLEEQIVRLADELRITTQRVNLFEKVKIPETRQNIRVIAINLGDQQTAGVVRAKIAKAKLTEAIDKERVRERERGR